MINYNEGDIVHVRAKCVSLDTSSIKIYIGNAVTWVSIHDVIKIETKSICVGDKVLYRKYGSKETGEVIAINEKLAWVKWGVANILTELNELERAQEQLQ